jgi:hypothetical protein
MAPLKLIWVDNVLNIITTSITRKQNVQLAAESHKVNLDSLKNLYELLSQKKKKERSVCFPPSNPQWRTLTPLVLTRLDEIGHNDLIRRLVSKAS